MVSWKRVNVNGAEVEFSAQGTGEPVVFIHGSILADAFAPLIAETRLNAHYRLVSYHRRGYAGSTHSNNPVSIQQQAADCRQVMKHAYVERAHIVGHSYGGVIALQLALDAPKSVHSLSLLEPALIPLVPSGPEIMQQMMPIVHMYEAGNKAGAVDAFLKASVGPDYRSVIDKVLPPGAFELAVADADTFFMVEFPALQPWRFTHNEAERIRQPVLSVRGANSPPWAKEIEELLLKWIPRARPLVLPKANHMLQIMNPQDMAENLARFLAFAHM